MFLATSLFRAAGVIMRRDEMIKNHLCHWQEAVGNHFCHMMAVDVA
jgi:hypothetical protein